MAILYVNSATGNDVNTRAQAQSSSTPRRTIAGIQAIMVSGDIAEFAAGTYPGQIYNPVSGTASAYTIFRAATGARPVIVQRAGQQFDRGIYVDNGGVTHHIEINGFEISGVYDGLKLTMPPPQTSWAHHFRFLNNVVHDTIFTGFYTDTDQGGAFLGGDHLVQGNEFYRIGSGNPGYVPGQLCMYNTGNRTIIEDNYFHDCTNGVGIWHDQTPIQNVIVRRNRFYRMGRPDINAWIGNPTLMSAVEVVIPGGGHKIYNNVIWDSGSTSIFEAFHCSTQVTAATTAYFYNNTIYNLIHASAKAGFSIYPAVEFKNNIIYRAGTGFSGGTQANNITANPLFAGVNTANFHLLTGSPAIGTGQNFSASFTTDYDNLTRTLPWDVGAYKATVGGIDVTPPAVPTGLQVT